MFNEHKQGCALPFVRERERLDCLLYGKILCIGSFGGGIISKMCSPARHPHTFIWRSQPMFATLRSKQQTCPNQKSLPANMPIKMYIYIYIYLYIYMCVYIIYIYSVCVCSSYPPCTNVCPIETAPSLSSTMFSFFPGHQHCKATWHQTWHGLEANCMWSCRHGPYHCGWFLGFLELCCAVSPFAWFFA